MGIFNFKKEKEEEDKKAAPAAAAKPAAVKVDAKPASADKSDKIKKAEPASKKETGIAAERKGREVFGVLLRPIITEQSSALNALNQYAFAVDKKANKIMIAEAVASRYGIKPVSVNVSNYFGKVVRYGRHFGRTKSWKKAVITLPEGKSINIYEGPAK